MQVYFDNAATTPVREEAAKTALDAMTRCWGNPSSRHRAGREAAELLEKARGQVAAALGADPGEIAFTSGGTEADNWALLSGAHLRRRGRVLIGETEHEAVKNPAEALAQEGYEVIRLRPDANGVTPLSALLEALTEDTVLVSVMLVNNETGAINPVKELAAATHRMNPDAVFHTDAVQAFGKLAFAPKALGVDLLSVSSHKIHGVKGAGALWIRQGLRLRPLILGGGQERERRSGTEAIPAIAAFGTAAELAARERAENGEKVAALSATLRALLGRHVPEARVLSENGSPYILSISLPGWRSETLMNFLDAKGIAVSNSSACRRGRRSEVLTAMGLDAAAIDGALRLSFSADNTAEEAAYFVDSLSEAVTRLRGTARPYKEKRS